VARVTSGVLLAAAFFSVVWFGNATVLLFVALAVGVLAFHEYAELLRQLGASIPRIPTVFATMGAIAVVPFPYVAGEALVGTGLVIIATAAMVGAGRMATAAKSRPSPVAVEPGTDMAPPEGRHSGTGVLAIGQFRASVLGAVAGGFAVLYIGLPLGALVGIHIFGGRGAVLLLVATIAISDTAQYYSGRTFGRHKLAPRLSPKKTIEGAVGGFIVAPVFLYFAGPYLVPVVTPLTIAPLGLVLVACGIAGDLFESMIKRAADIKDSSALIPGHGGVLDRIDALLFATPPFYMYLRWVYTA
jgi:phosphatidate cytidylyltransferase